MVILERLIDGLVQIAVVDLIGAQPGSREGQLVELAREIAALLVGALSRRGEGGEFGINLEEEFAEFIKVKTATLVLVVLFKEFIKATEVIRGLGEALLDTLGDVTPFTECDLHGFGVFAFFECEVAEEVNEVVGDVVLNGGAVTDGVDGTEGCSVETKMGICFQSMSISLNIDFTCDALAEFRLS